MTGTIPLPLGRTAEDVCRIGMEMESEGIGTAQIAARIGVGRYTYEQMRDVVKLSDRTDITASDRIIAAEALALMNSTSMVAASRRMIDGILVKMRSGARNVSGAAGRIAQFDHAFGLMAQACETMAEYEIPYLSASRIDQCINQIDDAMHNLAAMRRRFTEVRE